MKSYDIIWIRWYMPVFTPILEFTAANPGESISRMHLSGNEVQSGQFATILTFEMVIVV